MARQVLPWVGAAIGFAAGGNWQLGFAIGSLIGNAVDPQTIRGPSIGEGQNNTASEGGYRPIVLGKGAVGVCMIHQGPTIKRVIRERQSKGGGPVTEQERIYRTMAFALGEAADPDEGVLLLRLWIDNKLRYDVTPTSQIAAESAEFANEFTYYPGNDTQEPDPDLEAMPVEWGGGAGNVPSYRGGAPYIVLPEWDVTDSGGRAPMIKAELASSSTQEGRALIYLAGQQTLSSSVRVSEDGDTFPVVEETGLGANIARIHAAGGAVYVFSANSAAGRVKLNSESDWVPVVGMPTGSGNVEDMAYSEGVWVCVFSAGGISRSTDGINFSSVVINTRSRGTVAGLGNTFLAGGSQGFVAASFDKGLTWAEYMPNAASPITETITSIVATDSSFVLGILSQNDVLVSSTGAEGSWSEYPHPFTAPENRPFRFGYRDGTVVMVVDSNSATSTTGGTSWSVGGTLFVPANQSRVAANTVGFFIGSGQSSAGSVARSTDGATWTLSSYDDNAVLIAAADASLLPVTAGDPITLESVFDFVHARVDIPTSKYDASTLTQLLEGVVFAEGYTGADAIRAAMGWYQVDAGEFDAGSGYRINYVLRGGAALSTLTEADIIDGPEDWEREDSYERPRVLHVAYPNPVADYGAPVIPIKRTSHDVLVVGERSVSIPFVTSDQDEVARRGDVALTVIYTEIAGTVEVILPISWLELAPTDCIGYSIRGRVRRLRMTNWRFQPDGTISTEWIADRQSAYTSNLTALPPVPSTPPPPSIVGPTVSAVLDIPALVDSLDTLHLVVAASGQTPGWYGASHQRQAPGDPDFTTAAQFTAPTTIMGTLDDDVSDASEHFTDTTNVVRVTLYSDDELQTFTQEQFLSENGAFALAWEDSGIRRWEVMQYRDAVKVGERTWEVTTLARGRLDTETADHPAGSLFVLLDAGIRAINMQSAWLDEDVTHRAVSFGQNPDQATPYTEEYTGESQREWPVANLFAELDGDTLQASWVPRHRFGTDDHPVRSVNWTGYRVTATDGSNTLSVDTMNETYSFDVTGWSTPITVSVSQLNRFTGQGPAVTEEVA